MTLAELESQIMKRFAATSGHPDKEDPTITVFSRADNKKWFAATKNIGRRFIDAGDEGRIDILNVKLAPREVAQLRERKGFKPAWHMNRNNWVTVLLDGSVPSSKIFELLTRAFELAGKGGKR